MGETQKITFKSRGRHSRLVNFLMWAALASASLTLISAFLFEWVLAAVGFVLLVIAQKAGKHFSKMDLRDLDEQGLTCERCGQGVDLNRVASGPVPEDRLARCGYCGEPFGRFST